MVPGIIAALNNYNFITNCIALDIEGNTVHASREIDGGKENQRLHCHWLLVPKKELLKKVILEFPI